jgi:hypothetical protein
MSTVMLNQFPLKTIAAHAAELSSKDAWAYIQREVQPGRGLNRDERQTVRDQLWKLRGDLIKASEQPQRPKPRQPTERHYPTPAALPYSPVELRRAVEEIQQEIEYRWRNPDAPAWLAEFSECARWVLSQVERPCCLRSTSCVPGEALCTPCRWLCAIYSKGARAALAGTMFEVEHRIGTLNLLPQRGGEER